MPRVQAEVMKRLYGQNIWDNFTPDPAKVDLQGWNGDHPALKRLTSAPGDKVVLDVGVWKGLSTIHMARALQAAGIDGCVIAIDTFLGSIENWSNQEKLFARIHGRPNLYEIFLNNVVASGLADYIVPIAQTTLTAAAVLSRSGINASVIHIDAAHDYESVAKDIDAYWKLLALGGYLIGDDYHETWPGVVRAAGEFSARVERPLTVEPHKWILQKR